ncbi:MAG TPA: ABC transporter permease [Ktedonobacteraceae bacterium]|jgi:peptide/nickel transport system permease protein
MHITDVSGHSAALAPAKPAGRVSKTLRFFLSNPKIAVGIGVIVFFLMVAIAAPLLTPYSPDARVIRGAQPSQPPSLAHPFGTTDLGQDLFSQVVYGARVTLLIAFIAAIGSTALQVLFGLSAAYLGGLVDDLLSLIINVGLVLPGLPLTIVLASLASAASVNRNELVIALVLLFTSWQYGARVLRAQTLSLKEREFVSAARASGESAWRIIFVEILPNEMALVASTFVGTFVYVMGAEIALEFLGLGDPSQASWGSILYWAQNDSALPAGQWWLFVPAGLCIALFCGSLAFMNFGIDEIANPRLHVEKPPKGVLKTLKKAKEVVA